MFVKVSIFEREDQNLNHDQAAPLQEKSGSRPNTSKPRDPDSYQFVNDEIAKDYRKLWDQYQELQRMRSEASSAVTAVTGNGTGSHFV